MDSQNIVRNIVKEVMKELGKLNVKIETNLCYYYIKLLKLDPNWCISDNIMRNRTVVQNFVKHVVSRLKNLGNPDDLMMLTIKLQYYCYFHLENIQEYALIPKMGLIKKLDPLQFSIIEPLVYRDDLDLLFEKMVYYITFVSGLGNPKNLEVYKEVAVVLRSVMDEKELAEFPKDLYVVRREKLDMLVKLVSGIRLYNKHCAIGGKGIENLPLLLSNAIKAVRDYFYQVLHEESDKINLITRTLENCYKIRSLGDKVVVDCMVPLGIEESHLDNAKDLLVVYNQYLFELRELLAKVDQVRGRSVMIQKTYDQTLEYLHLKIIRNLRLRASLVFPSFEKLFDTWRSFQDEVYMLIALKHIFDKQYTNVKELNPYQNGLVAAYIASTYDDNTNFVTCKLDYYIMTVALVTETGAETFRKGELQDIDNIKFEYSGFCCWTLVFTGGVLKKGNVDYGVARYQNRYYKFCKVEAFHNFIKHPTYFIFHVLEMARKKCELINLLNMEEQLRHYARIKRLTLKIDTGRMCRGAQMNVNTHLPSSNIDLNYEWNIWNLKRRALFMANLENRKTTSSQTAKTGTMESWGCQKNVNNTHETQTKIDVQFNTTQLTRVFCGLRDTKANEVFTMNLEADYCDKNKS